MVSMFPKIKTLVTVYTVVFMPPCKIPHTKSSLKSLIEQIKILIIEKTKSVWRTSAKTMNRSVLDFRYNPILFRDLEE